MMISSNEIMASSFKSAWMILDSMVQPWSNGHRHDHPIRGSLATFSHIQPLGLAVSMVAFKGTQSNVPLRGGKPAVSNDTS